jgi:carbon monoxide dehydrogenase subunit G
VTKLTNTIEIEASPEKIWNWAMDQKNMNEASKGFSESTWTSTAPYGVGSVSHFISRAGGTTTETDLEVTEFVVNKKFAQRSIGASKTKMAFSYTLEPAAKGTKVALDIDYEVPYSILGKLIDKLKVQKDVEKGNSKLLENMKKAIEAK